MTTLSNDERTPSLLEKASRGGDINEGGISFQTAVGMSYIPRWVAMEGFTSMLREGIFDVEAKFFVPHQRFVREGIEVKDHSVTPSEFWNEVERFKQVDAGSPHSYQWFTLACAGLSKDLHPLRNSLRRIRGPYGFYRDDATILENSYQTYVETVKRLGQTEEDAEFLYRRVLLVDDLSPHREYSKALFKQALNNHLPYHRDMPDRILDDIHAHLGEFVQSRRNQTITRQELGEKLRNKVPQKLKPPTPPIRLYTAISVSEISEDRNVLRFEWQPFFGGEGRNYPPPEVWNQRMLGELRETRDWIIANRNGRRIHLSGNRRLSASFAIGYIFSAVAGFSIEMDYRGDVWATDAHADNQTPNYPLQVTGSFENVAGEHLVVSIGIIRSIAQHVELDLPEHGLAGMPTLHLKGAGPIVSAQQANLLVQNIKQHISVTLSQTGARQIDLFYAGPAYISLFLGHRMNATAAIQCYEQSGTGGYTATCRLI
jgi:hypothetical protein